jgi:DNA invertase Pin-like site-specific DNA recombinase
MMVAVPQGRGREAVVELLAQLLVAATTESHGRTVRRSSAMKTPDLPASVLERRAIVYVRQSTSVQVHDNLESQRRQYALADLAQACGFHDVVTIDDDLGRSASGVVSRPGFEALVAQPCQGLVGAVFCLEASRLARNGRDWHHLLELCGLVGARVVDGEGAYDPSVPNDRLLLGLKGR